MGFSVLAGAYPVNPKGSDLGGGFSPIFAVSNIFVTVSFCPGVNCFNILPKQAGKIFEKLIDRWIENVYD